MSSIETTTRVRDTGAGALLTLLEAVEAQNCRSARQDSRDGNVV